MLEPLELVHVKEIQDAIQDILANPERNHGSFVTYMAAKNYGRAAFSADTTMAKIFCDLVMWRERLGD
jgi:hypothetical protein